MTDINSIFKSELTDEQKKAKSLFGKLLIALRSQNHMRIYSLMNGVIDTNIRDNVIVLRFEDKTSYALINNLDDINCINSILKKKKKKEYQVEFDMQENNDFDIYKFEEFLKSEFGRILTIK